MAILTEAPTGAQILDLGAARAARAEARTAAGEGNPYLKLAAGFVEVKPEFALATAFAFKDENIKGGLEGLLVDPSDVDAIIADGLTAQDLQEIAKFISGNSLGESSASPKP